MSDGSVSQSPGAGAAAYALLLGNFVTAVSVLAPAGMLKDLADGLGVKVGEAGLLVTFGAIVMCFGSPLVAWATSRIERRKLLVATIAVLAAGHVLSALAPSYGVLLTVRILMLATASIFTPQAASTIALIVSERERAGAIALVFVGWSLSIAFGLPLVTQLSAAFGWRAAHAVLAVLAVICALGLAASLPRGLFGPPVLFRSWGVVLRSRLLLLIFLVTILSAVGQFLLLTYLGPLLTGLTGAEAGMIAAFFAGFGVMGIVGNLAATRTVARLGVYWNGALCFLAIFLGMVLWSLGAGSLVVMALGMAVWGLGFASGNSMQQARLAATAPDLAAATIALNTSSIYIGQTLGSAIGGLLFEQGRLVAMGYVAATCVALSLVAIALSRSDTN